MVGTALRQEINSSQAILLLDTIGRVSKSLGGRVGVHVHLSRLLPQNRREHHIRIAAGTFDALMKRFEGQLFEFVNNDLVILLRDAPLKDVGEVVERLRFMFGDDPLAAYAEDFATVYDLQTQVAEFRQMAEAAVADAEKRRKEQRNLANRAMGLPDEDAPKSPINPASLGRLEQGVASMDLSALLRRQPVAVLLPNTPPKVVFNEVYVSVTELARKIAPETDLTADLWLFRHFSHVLDLRVLQMLPQTEAQNPVATSININIATLLSPQFLTFDQRLRAVTQKTLMFELDPMDVFRDLGAFFFVRDFLRSRGYRICLDGLNHLSFPMIERRQLGFDMEKIYWATDLTHGGVDANRDRFRQAVKDSGAARVVLCRCDSPEAVEFGRELGITLFQGRYIDRLLTGGVGSAQGGRPAA
jgi:EAL domain-containing protein (putative c-di-GMP-specific phosphodiesterase class I)